MQQPRNNQEYLIPVNTRPREEQIAISRKGGSVGGPKKALAARLRYLKKKGLTEATANEFYKLMTNPDISSLDILKYLKLTANYVEQSGSLADRQKLARLMMDWHKLQHGDKKSLDVRSVNINANVDNNRAMMTPELAAELLEDVR